jgi:hypothetical protein
MRHNGIHRTMLNNDVRSGLAILSAENIIFVPEAHVKTTNVLLKVLPKIKMLLTYLQYAVCYTCKVETILLVSIIYLAHPIQSSMHHRLPQYTTRSHLDPSRSTNSKVSDWMVQPFEMRNRHTLRNLPQRWSFQHLAQQGRLIIQLHTVTNFDRPSHRLSDVRTRPNNNSL